MGELLAEVAEGGDLKEQQTAQELRDLFLLTHNEAAGNSGVDGEEPLVDEELQEIILAKLDISYWQGQLEGAEASLLLEEASAELARKKVAAIVLELEAAAARLEELS